MKEFKLTKATPLENFKSDDYHKLKKVELVKKIRVEQSEFVAHKTFWLSRYLGDLKKIKDIMSTFDYESGDDDDFINNIKQIIDKY
eukprot:SAG22_NODE_6861_length_802_cov_3.157895_1_plen_86_part_00